MADNLYDHIVPNIWPPNSPDLNPLDYYVWSVVEKDVNEYGHDTKDSLKAAIVRVMSDMNKEQFGPAVRVFANGPGDLGSIPGRVIPKTLKMVLDTTLLNTQHYKVRFKGKVEQSWEWSSALPYTLV